MFKKIVTVLLIVIVVGIVSIQFVPVARSNPPITATINAPQPVMEILRRSCFDCHSNETTWPWYSKVAPVSWLVARDVQEGRSEMNFSEWDRYDAERQAHLITECYEEVQSEAMPMPIYLLTHTGAAITPEQLQTLRDWAAIAGEKSD